MRKPKRTTIKLIDPRGLVDVPVTMGRSICAKVSELYTKKGICLDCNNKKRP